MRHREKGTIILAVYVDDIVITDSDSEGIELLKSHLSKHFHMERLRVTKLLFGY